MADVYDNSPQGQASTPSVVADDELAQRAVRDTTAFAELYRRYLPRVYRYVLAQLGDLHQAQDVTSQTFLTAFESIDTFRGTGAFSSWLLTIARHRVIDSKRRQKAVAPLEEAAHLASRDLSPEQIAETHLRDRAHPARAPDTRARTLGSPRAAHLWWVDL